MLPNVMRSGTPTTDAAAEHIDSLLRRNARDENGPSYTRLSSFSFSSVLPSVKYRIGVEEEDCSTGNVKEGLISTWERSIMKAPGPIRLTPDLDTS